MILSNAFLLSLTFFFPLLVASNGLVPMVIEEHHMARSRACVLNYLVSTPVTCTVALNCSLDFRRGQSRVFFCVCFLGESSLNKIWCKNIESSISVICPDH